MKTCLAFLTYEKPDLSRQSIVPLLDCGADIMWVDGSTSVEASALPFEYNTKYTFSNVRGGAGAAIVFALTEMLERGYDYVGLVESDVLLGPNWFADTMDLFSVSPNVGAASARCYEDRILFQCDGHAICHNLGAGQIILSREAATLVLQHFRTGWTADNRRVFGKLAGIDIGSYWAFRGGEHWLTADWHWDALLAAHGYASLALTPSPCEMIGQNPPLAEQGLTIAARPVEARRSEDMAQAYFSTLKRIRDGRYDPNEFKTPHPFSPSQQSYIVFPHQVVGIGGWYDGSWRLKEVRGWGTFAWTAVEPLSILEGPKDDETAVDTQVHLPVIGACTLMIGGGEKGGEVFIEDKHTGYSQKLTVKPEASSQVASIVIPPTMVRRTISITFRTPGVTFYGLTCREPQLYLPAEGGFTHKQLAPA